MSRASSANGAGAAPARRRRQRRKQRFACCRVVRHGAAWRPRRRRPELRDRQPHDRADDAVRHEGDQNDEHQAENEFPKIADGGHLLQQVAQRQPDRGADGRADQRAGAAHHGLDDELARSVQREGVRRHVALENTEQRAAAAGEHGGQHEHGELVGAHVVAERGGALRILPDRRQHRADRRQHDDSARTRSRRKRIRRRADSSASEPAKL